MRPTEAEIDRYIRDNLLDEPFDGVDPLAELELDSLTLEELIDYLEETYEFLFDDEEMARENLNSLAKVAAVVDRKRLLPRRDA